jgi:hypothetical protein
MAAGGPVDPTEPVPTNPERRGAPMGEPTGQYDGDATLPGAYDPTVAVPPVDADGGGPIDGDDDGTAGDEGDDRRKWLWGALAALGVIILGVIIALLVSGGGDDNNKTASSTSTSHVSTSTSSSSTSTSTTSTTATTVPGGPSVTSFSSNPANTVSCPNQTDTVQVNFTWATANASGVSITIDGGQTQSFGPSGSAALPFNCGGNAHSYALTAHGANNQTASRTITLQRSLPPPPTTTAPPATTTTTHA